MEPTTVVFYDGLCGLCDRLVRFLLARDRRGALRFAPLQGAIAARELRARGKDPADLDTMYVLAGWMTSSPRLLERSRAVLHAVEQIGGGWRLAAQVARVVPVPIADRVYGVIARWRYRIFGRFAACPLPRPEWRARFLDDGGASAQGRVETP